MKNFHLFIRVFRAQNSLLRFFLSAYKAQKSLPGPMVPAGKAAFILYANSATT